MPVPRYSLSPTGELRPYRQTPVGRLIAALRPIPHTSEYEFPKDVNLPIKWHFSSLGSRGSWLATVDYRTYPETVSVCPDVAKLMGV